MRLSHKYNLFLGYVVLVLSILGIVSFVVVPSIPYRWQTSDFAQICKGEKSYYYTSTLYNAEKKSFSDQAKAYQILYFGSERLRIVADGQFATNEKKEIRLILKLDNAGRKDINLKNVNFLAKFSNQSQQSFSIDEKSRDLKVASSTILAETKELTDDYSDNSLSIDLEIYDSNHNCSLTIAKAIQIDLSKSASEKSFPGGINVGEFGEASIPSGLSPVGFSDWRLFAPFYDKAISILSYDGSSWQPVEQEGDFIAKPGIGYYFYNPSPYIVKINSNMFFEVPSDVATSEVHPGWNLLYNDLGRDAKLEEIKVSAWPKNEKMRSFIADDQSLQNLIEQHLASDEIYLTDNPTLSGNQGLYPLALDQPIPEASVFWLYVFDLPKTQVVLPNFDFALTTDKEQYDQGTEIALTYKIVNKDEKSHVVDASKENDPCQIGLEVFDEKGQKIYSEKDDSEKNCPLWPQSLTLGNGEAVEYSRKWQIPTSIKGKIKLRGYFDYTRLNSSDIINSEVETKVGR